MAVLNYSTNLTKYDAGGSGNNIIADGLIKSVEKVWLDTYVYSSAATIGSTMTIEIASIPAGKKITGIEVIGLDALSATSTNAISIGTKMTQAVLAGGTYSTVTNSTFFLAATTFGTGTLRNAPLFASLNLPYELTGGTNRIFVQFSGASPSITGGTLYFKTKYT